MLHYGISYGLLNESSDLNKELAAKRFDRLSEGEKQFFHADPFMQTGLCHLLLQAEVRTVVPSSVGLIFHRYFQLSAESMLCLIEWIARTCVRDTDPGDFVILCQKFVDGPFKNRVMNRESLNRIFTYWFLDRFGGVAANIGTATDADFYKKLKRLDDDSSSMFPRVTNLLVKRWGHERIALFESWAKEEEIKA